MKFRLSRSIRTGALALVVLAMAGSAAAQAARGTSGPYFAITFPASAHAGAITGRVYVMLARKADPEPRLQIGRTGIPFFGHDIERLAPGQTAIIDASDLGTPIVSLRDVPAGDYYVQAFINIYSEFRRADGHTVWMHDDQWEGQRWNRSPGNLKSAVRQVHFDPAAGGTITLTADQVLPPITVPADTEYVQRFKFQSRTLTQFWGRPIYLGATVLLPKDYARATVRYPVIYIQGHFSLRAPDGFDGKNAFSQAWMGDKFPRMILVTFQHPNPYFDDSYAVNSVNVGPYGDAIMHELIPEIERRYRTIPEPYARILTGGSTGGWESLALQLVHPDFFGGTWAYCPDSVTFTNVEGIDAYSDTNAFYKQYDWRREPTINSRYTDGRVVMTSQERNRFELVNGTHGRSGEQLDIWSAVFGPLGADGYFQPLFDKQTGVIDPTVAQYWKEHYDLLEFMKRNWPMLGPKLVDKLHVYVGTMDTYELNIAVEQMQAWMRTTETPHYEGFFLYGDQKPHCWTGPVSPAERLQEIGEYIAAHKPESATTPWWQN